MSCDKRITAAQSLDPFDTIHNILDMNGPLFETLKESSYPRCMDEAECILVKSHSTDWVGWIEIRKINIQPYYRTPCTSAILKYLGVNEWSESRYLEDCTEILKKQGWVVTQENIISYTVGSLRKEIKANRLCSKAIYFMVIMSGHVLLLDSHGDTCCDTAPVSKDRRHVYNVYSITSKERESFSSNLSYAMSKIK